MLQPKSELVYQDFFPLRRILVDAGDENKPEYLRNLKNLLQEEGVTVEHIIITHWHHDHIGGVKEILEFVGPGSIPLLLY